MANTLSTHDILASRLLINLKNQLTFSKNVYKGFRKEFHSINGFQVGDAVRVNLPRRYRAKSGATLDEVNVYEETTTVTVDEHYHVALRFLATELTQDINWDRIDRDHLIPAAITLANKVDSQGCLEYSNVYNMVGTPGSVPSTYGVIVDAATRLHNEAIPFKPRIGVLSPNSAGAMADGELKGVFDQQNVRRLTEEGFIGQHYGGIDFYMDQNIYSHTVGTYSGTIRVKTASSEGDTSIALKGFTPGNTLKNGDIISIATVYGVNPISGQVWENNQKRQFVVTADATADASGDMTVSVSPKIYSESATEDYLPYQSVNGLPAVNDVVTVESGDSGATVVQNLIFHPNCFALTMVPFARFRSAGQSIMQGQAMDEDIGLSITVSTGADIENFRESTRADILFGWDTVEGNYGVRLAGA